MADYTTVVRVRNSLGTMGADQLQAATVTESIARATAVVRAALGKSRAAAVDAIQTGATDELLRESTPKLPRSVVTDLSAFYCMKSLGRVNLVNGEILKMPEDVAALLAGLKDGSLDISEISTQIQVTSNTEGYEPIFQADDPVGQDLDQARADDIEDARL